MISQETLQIKAIEIAEHMVKDEDVKDILRLMDQAVALCTTNEDYLFLNTAIVKAISNVKDIKNLSTLPESTE
jgi:hypothetical protein